MFPGRPHRRSGPGNGRRNMQWCRLPVPVGQVVDPAAVGVEQDVIEPWVRAKRCMASTTGGTGFLRGRAGLVGVVGHPHQPARLGTGGDDARCGVQPVDAEVAWQVGCGQVEQPPPQST